MNIADNIFAGSLVRLAASSASDYDLMAKWSENTEYSRMGNFGPSRLESGEFWRRVDQHSKDAYNFRIRTLSDDTLIGFIHLQVNWPNQVAEVGIAIGDPAYWSHGYGSDAMRVTVNYAFRELGLYKIMLGVFSYNTRAIRSYEKAGFVHEARARAIIFRDGQHYDMLHMGILRPEWEARLKAQPASTTDAQT